MQIKKEKRATVEGYLVVDRRSGLVRAFRRNVVQAFSVADSHRGSLVMLVRIPQEQEVLYRAAEVQRDSVNPKPGGEFVRSVWPNEAAEALRAPGLPSGTEPEGDERFEDVEPPTRSEKPGKP